MEGYLKIRLNPWIRRLLTRLVAIVPAVLVIGFMGEDRVDALLIFSQVILSLQLGYAVIPLIHFVSDKSKMGEFVIPTYVKVLAWLSAIIIVGLNVKLVSEQIIDWHGLFGNSMWYNFLVIPIVILCGFMLLYINGHKRN
jgi:manganese transport protein